MNPNFSSPSSIAILSSLAIRDETFNQIVNAKEYELEIKN
jgi:hypothetical protein